MGARAGGLSGVYGTYTKVTSYHPQLGWLDKTQGWDHWAFFPDGRFYYASPEQGLDNFNYAVMCRRNPNFCGAYRMAGGRGTLTFADNGQTWPIERDGDKIRIKGKPYERLDPCDGLVLALDLLLSEPAQSADDQALAETLGRFQSVILGDALTSDPVADPKWILPLPFLRESRTVGHFHSEPDTDGIVRSVVLAKENRDRRFWALGFQMARAAIGAGTPLETRDSVELGPIRIPAPEAPDPLPKRQMVINYAGPEGTFRRVPFSSLLDNTLLSGGGIPGEAQESLRPPGENGRDGCAHPVFCRPPRSPARIALLNGGFPMDMTCGFDDGGGGGS